MIKIEPQHVMTECLISAFDDYDMRLVKDGRYDVVVVTVRGRQYEIWIDENTVGDSRWGRDIRYDLLNPNCNPYEIAEKLLIEFGDGRWWNNKRI